MTVATTSTFELQVDQLCTRSLQIAGLLAAGQSAEAADLAMCHDFLNMELDALQAEGITLRTVTRTSQAISLVAHTLPADTIDVYVGPDNMLGTVLAAGSTTETLVKAIRRHEYLAISNKTSTGTPVLCCVERQGAVTVTFWPVPSASFTFNYQKVRGARDTSDGSTTPDVDVRRQKALLWSIAFDIAVAKSQPISRCEFLKGERDRLKAFAKWDDVERGHGQLYIAHTVS